MSRAPLGCLAATIVLMLTAASAAPSADTPPERDGTASVWLGRKAAELQVLDKINARHGTLSVPVGQQAHYGSLTIDVRNCVVRPANQPAEAAAFLTVTDANNEGVAFQGWMIAGQPALSMLQHPVFDLRVLGCTP